MGKLVYKLEGMSCKILSPEYGLIDPLSLFVIQVHGFLMC
jgi:hypothetical protein